ncbi:MAG: sigma-70 family RNA polymerase sigma factor [Chloroflexota bacterium]
MSLDSVDVSSEQFEREALPHVDALLRTALRMTRNQQSAEDLVQETLIRAYSNFHRYEPGTNIRAWMFKIMTYLSISQYRRQMSAPRTESLDEPTPGGMFRQARDTGMSADDVESRVLGQLGEEQIQDAIDHLGPEIRMVVMLADVEGFAYKEIAEIMGIPVGTVMSRLHRGRRLLQHALWHHAVAAGYVREGVTA